MAKKRAAYIVSRGKVPGVYTTWTEVTSNAFGVPNGCHEGFSSLEEAQAAYNRLLDEGLIQVIPSDSTPVRRNNNNARRNRNRNHNRNHDDGREEDTQSRASSPGTSSSGTTSRPHAGREADSPTTPMNLIEPASNVSSPELPPRAFSVKQESTSVSIRCPARVTPGRSRLDRPINRAHSEPQVVNRTRSQQDAPDAHLSPGTGRHPQRAATASLTHTDGPTNGTNGPQNSSGEATSTGSSPPSETSVHEDGTPHRSAHAAGQAVKAPTRVSRQYSAPSNLQPSQIYVPIDTSAIEDAMHGLDVNYTVGSVHLAEITVSITAKRRLADTRRAGSASQDPADRQPEVFSDDGFFSMTTESTGPGPNPIHPSHHSHNSTPTRGRPADHSSAHTDRFEQSLSYESLDIADIDAERPSQDDSGREIFFSTTSTPVDPSLDNSHSSAEQVQRSPLPARQNPHDGRSGASKAQSESVVNVETAARRPAASRLLRAHATAPALYPERDAVVGTVSPRYSINGRAGSSVSSPGYSRISPANMTHPDPVRSPPSISAPFSSEILSLDSPLRGADYVPHPDLFSPIRRGGSMPAIDAEPSALTAPNSPMLTSPISPLLFRNMLQLSEDVHTPSDALDAGVDPRSPILGTTPVPSSSCGFGRPSPRSGQADASISSVIRR